MEYSTTIITIYKKSKPSKSKTYDEDDTEKKIKNNLLKSNAVLNLPSYYT